MMIIFFINKIIFFVFSSEDDDKIYRGWMILKYRTGTRYTDHIGGEASFPRIGALPVLYQYKYGRTRYADSEIEYIYSNIGEQQVEQRSANH